MNIKQFRRRVWALVVLLAVVITSLGATLYDIQINNGEEYYRQSLTKISEYETVEAGRGQILDRNGRVLVSDSPVYQVRLDTKRMGDTKNRADVILQLVQVARESGVEWDDSKLPISRSAPFTFTTDNPYYTEETDEEGNVTKKLTILGKIGVDRRWIRDPLAPPEQSQEETAPEPGLWDRIQAFLSGEDPQPEVVEPEKPYTLPTAEELLGILCSYFEVQGEGAVDEKEAKAAGQEVPVLNIGSLSPQEARDAVGVLYELEIRARNFYQVIYTFAKGVDIDFISRVKELGLPGISIEATTVRQYHTTYAAHILGRVGAMQSQEEIDYYTSLDEDGDGKPDYQMDDTVGREGAELAFESYLRGTPGTRVLERNTEGKIVSSTWTKEPSPGDNVILTLDLDLQMAVEDILAQSLRNLASSETEGAACVVMDIDSAEVLAAASYPTYNLATYSQDFQENNTNPLRPFNNRAFKGAYPPGSTFKMVTAIAGLEEGVITPSTQIRDMGAYTYYGGTPQKCWLYRQSGRTHGLENVSDAIEDSCNYFFFEVGRLLGIERLDDYAARFGIGEKTGLEVDEAVGVMASPEFTESMGGTWYPGSTLSAAIGQESTQVTPVQLANYICTLCNGGSRNAAHLLRQVKSSDFSSIVFTQEPEVLSSFEIEPRNLDAVKRGMLRLTTQGSVAKYFNRLDVKVGAKTGSAQISSKTESNSIFVCFAPYDDPEIAISIVVEHGGSGAGLGAMCADILDYYFSAKENREELLKENTMIH